VAVSLRTFEHSLMPGLLQTPEYATAVLRARPHTREEDIEELVAARLARQAVLEREDPPIVWVLLDEGVLHRPAAPPDVMYRQLTHLAEMSRLPNIAIQVVPYGAGGHCGLLGAFVIADLDGSASIVFLDDAADGRVTEDAAAISRVIVRFDSLRGEALPKSASRDMIASVAEERWRPPGTGGHGMNHSRPASGTRPARSIAARTTAWSDWVAAHVPIRAACITRANTRWAPRVSVPYSPTTWPDRTGPWPPRTMAFDSGPRTSGVALSSNRSCNRPGWTWMPIAPASATVPARNSPS